MTLTDFLLARIADDEADWRAVDAQPVQQLLHGRPIAPKMLAECEAKRRIVEEHTATHGGGSVEFCGVCGWNQSHISEDDGCFDRAHSHYPCATLSLLALPYADHPDYREEWRP